MKKLIQCINNVVITQELYIKSEDSPEHWDCPHCPARGGRGGLWSAWRGGGRVSGL